MASTMKADLDAANREVRNVMNENIELKMKLQTIYGEGYRDALQALDNLSRINQSQAGIITYLMGIVAGGLKPR